MTDESTQPKQSYSRRDIRSLAFHFIYAMEQFDYDTTLQSIIDNFRLGFDLDIPDDSPAIVMAREVIEQRAKLDELMLPLLKNWEMARIGLCTRLILRFALWELTEPGAVPSIVINEAIELAKGFAEKDAYKFINGVLDEYCKQQGIKDPPKPESEDAGL